MKQLIRKILKEQDEVITLPNLDFFDGNWDDLLDASNGRKFRVRGNMDLRYICPETLGNLVSVEGNLNLNDCENLVSLGSLEYVGGYLDLWRCENLTSLGNLKYVGDTLDLAICENLTSLGNLKYVGGNLYINNTPIAEKYSLIQMIDVKGHIYFR
jgi:hypothetical protein